MILNLFILFSSVIIGGVLVYLIKPGKKFNQILLSFSGAYLLAITITHLLPEIFHSHGSHLHDEKSNIGIFIIIGLLFQLITDYLSRGAEHGHLHVHDNKLPKVLFFSLCLHAFMEGIPVNDHHHNDLLWAIVIHKIPIAMVLASFFKQVNTPLIKSITILTIFGLMSPLGSYTGNKIDFLIEYHTEITAFIVGIFLHISTIIIFESSENHKFNRAKFIAIVVGFAVAALI